MKHGRTRDQTSIRAALPRLAKHPIVSPIGGWA